MTWEAKLGPKLDLAFATDVHFGPEFYCMIHSVCQTAPPAFTAYTDCWVHKHLERASSSYQSQQPTTSNNVSTLQGSDLTLYSYLVNEVCRLHCFYVITVLIWSFLLFRDDSPSAFRYPWTFYLHTWNLNYFSYHCKINGKELEKLFSCCQCHWPWI